MEKFDEEHIWIGIMAYDIKLYVHGVPKGQCTWGVSSSDNHYIDTFYGRKSDVSKLMFVEVKQFGAETNCYYTYYRTGSYTDKDGRTGGYFALTLRLNYYYVDIQNMYNILDAAYKKFIIGANSILMATTNGFYKYLISDFSQVDQLLVDLESQLTQYLMQFSTDADFIPLQGFVVNGQGSILSQNLEDCDNAVMIQYVKAHGSFSVSPLFPSLKIQQIIKEKNSQIAIVEAKSKNEIDNAKLEAQRTIDAIRNEYKDTDRKIKALKQDNDKLEKALKDVQNENEKFKRKIDQIEKTGILLDDLGKIMEPLSKVVPTLKKLVELPKISVTRIGDEPKIAGERKSVINLIREKLKMVTWVFVIFVLGGIIGILVHQNISPIDNQSQQIAVLTQEIDSINNVLSVSQREKQKAVEGLRLVYKDATIDVAEISTSNPMRKGKTYQVSLEKVYPHLDGQWVSEDFVILKSSITPKHAGKCIIRYEVNGEVMVERNINVVE